MWAQFPASINYDSLDSVSPSGHQDRRLNIVAFMEIPSEHEAAVPISDHSHHRESVGVNPCLPSF